MSKSLDRLFKEKKGQMGLGFLIIAITIIILAALVTRVMLISSGTMDTQVTTTSEEAIQRVSTYIRIIGVMGYTTYNETDSPSGSNITKIILTARLVAESDAVKYNEIILSYHSDDVYISGIFFNDSVAAGTSVTEVDINTDNDIKDFEVVRSRDVIADDVLDPGETVEIHFWIEDGDGIDRQLAANKRFTLTVLPKNGQIVEVKKIAPDTVTSKYVVIA